MRDTDQWSAAPPLTEESATEHLDALEQRFGRPPAEILQIPERASVIEACVAFAALAAIHAPHRFIGLGLILTERAESAFRRLRRAFYDFVERSRPRLAPSAGRRIAHRERRMTPISGRG